MSRGTIILRSKQDRDKVKGWIDQLPDLSRVSLARPKRSLPQNDKMYAALTEIASQKEYFGLRLSPEDWKLIFMDALNREVRIVPNLDGNGMVNLGRSTSVLSKEDFSDLLEIIYEWGSRNGVIFGDDQRPQVQPGMEGA